MGSEPDVPAADGRIVPALAGAGAGADTEAAVGPAGSASGGLDEVDHLLAAWRRARPDLDVEPLAVLSRVSRLARHLDRIRRAAFAEHRLETFEFDVLAALRRAGPPHELSPGRLLVQTMVASGTMSHRLDRLEARGLVRRRADPRDGRAVRVRLTAQGRRRVDRAVATLLDRERLLLAGLEPAERSSFAALLRAVLIALDAPAGAGGSARGPAPGGSA